MPNDYYVKVGIIALATSAIGSLVATVKTLAYLDWLKIGDGFEAEGNPFFFSCNF